MKDKVIKRSIISLFLIILLPYLCFGNFADEIYQRSNIKGGLVVHAGCADGKKTLSLYANDSYLIHGLDKDPKNVEKARKFMVSSKKYGKVLIALYDGKNLPYADGIVNLLVVEDKQKISKNEMDRVLCPGGVVLINKNHKWEKSIKKYPLEIDEWTHFLHGPDNNAVAKQLGVNCNDSDVSFTRGFRNGRLAFSAAGYHTIYSGR